MIIDELLDRDTYLREEKGLSLDDVKAVFDYIDGAKERRWKVGWLIGIQTKLWNAGLMGMSSKDVENLTAFLEEMQKLGWDTGDIPEFLNNPFIKETLPQLSPKEGERLTSLLREIGLKGLTAGQYLKQVEEVRQTMSWHRAYKEGRVTYKQFKKMVNLH